MRYIWWLISLFAWGTAAQSLPAERIFLALEKESCMPGDTLFVNGQLLAADSRAHSPHSRYVYVECVDDRDSLLLRQKAACDAKGYFALEIPTQVDWLSNLCYLRAYTRLMQNYETESFTVAPFSWEPSIRRRHGPPGWSICAVSLKAGRCSKDICKTWSSTCPTKTDFPLSPSG